MFVAIHHPQDEWALVSQPLPPCGELQVLGPQKGIAFQEVIHLRNAHSAVSLMVAHQKSALFFFFYLADIKPPMKGSMAHTGLLSLGSLVLRITARPQAALVWLPCIHSEDSKANNEPTYSSQGPFYTPKFWASAAWQISVHEFQFSPLGSALFVHKNVLYSFPLNPMSIILNRKKSRLQNCFNTGSVIM